MFVQSTGHIVVLLYKYFLNEYRTLTTCVKISWRNGDGQHLEEAESFPSFAGESWVYGRTFASLYAYDTIFFCYFKVKVKFIISM